MRIILEIKHPKDFEALIPLLKRLKIRFFKPSELGDSDKSQEEKITTSAAIALTKPVEKWNFQKFYGSAKTNLTNATLDEQLNKMRQEWDRDLS